ncbi:hypothetical protein QQ008_01985 [Fulvivirgaceae bacterium BMA10]|uniref:Uncharacterized protein n=1 Tax=Splendidivirga corallicola TaxID=3051826 RepID=A0ABT8KJ77_9BACT|nr:hypothetical protein [Fulvivirgaceae bacterium BMA10]
MTNLRCEMFGFFKKNKKKKEEKNIPDLFDLNDVPIFEGDIVESLRYGLGKCKVINLEGKIHYESLENGKQVIWLKMVDAITEKQKVKKIVEDQSS